MKVLEVTSGAIAWTRTPAPSPVPYLSAGAIIAAVAGRWAGNAPQLQLVSAESARHAELVRQFNELADDWERGTRAESFLHRIAMHPAYQRIIGLGEPAVRLILERLRDRPGHWFWALHAITGDDPAVGLTNLGEAREAWLRWGSDRGYLSTA